jgi:hypothetical protein
MEICSWLLLLSIYYKCADILSVEISRNFLITDWAKEGARVVPEGKELPEAFKAYEDGKQRRYNLLFAVNGGAFAVAKLLHAKEPPDLGHLTTPSLSIGMIAFTLVMGWDIFEFGRKMRTAFSLDVFKSVGKTVLGVIIALICAGWALVAWPR